MIVTCPACSARYKIQEAKIPGRGAKITCPRCGHRFVFYRDDAGEGEKGVPDNVGTLNFAEFGVTWRVRKGPGKHAYEFHDLNTLREFVQDGQVAQWDQVSFDGREWTSLESIPSLDAFFWDVWQKLKSGALKVSPAPAPGEDASDEDDSDAPTTIVGRGSSLANEIRQAVADAATPSPVPHRDHSEEGHLVEEGDDEPVAAEVEEAQGADLAGPTEAPSPVRRSLPPSQPPASEPDRGAAPILPELAKVDPARPEVRPEVTRPAAPLPTSLGSGAAPSAAPVRPPEPKPPAPSGGGASPVVLVVGGVVVLLVLVAGALWASGLLGGGGSPAPRPAPAPVEAPAPAAPAPEAPAPAPEAPAPDPAAPGPAAPAPAGLAPQAPAPQAPGPAKAPAPEPSKAKSAPAEPAPAPAPAPAEPAPAPAEPAPAPAEPAPAPAPAPVEPAPAEAPPAPAPAPEVPAAPPPAPPAAPPPDPAAPAPGG
jgi:predicted Zn finger-like uncharacterized protein